VDRLEERLVEVAPGAWSASSAGLVAVGGHAEGVGHVSLDVVPADLGGSQLCFGLGQVGAKAFLLFAEDVDRHAAFEVGSDEVAALSLEVSDALPLAVALRLGSDGRGSHLFEQDCADVVCEFRAELDLSVQVGDGFLRVACAEEWHVAAVASVTAQAEEVLVLATASAG
jgi:hypothetical protein